MRCDTDSKRYSGFIVPDVYNGESVVIIIDDTILTHTATDTEPYNDSFNGHQTPLLDLMKIYLQ